jgi:ADP-ribose pyrophosphatase
MSQESWKKIRTEILLDHPRIKIVEDDVVLPTGTKTKYVRFEGLGDYVTVIAERDNTLALIREYSYPNDEWLLQFPEGVIEDGETPESTSMRELQEEAGLAAQHIERLGINYDHHRRSTSRDYVMIARGISEVIKTGGDEEEYGTELVWLGRDQIKGMLKRGDIVQKNAAAALALYFAHFDN